MKASFFSIGTYRNSVKIKGWPTAPAQWDREAGREAMEFTLEQYARADEVGFDWVSFSEHHYMPLLLQPNPMVMAAAVSQVVKRAKIALLGPIVSMSNPIRIAEEIAMVDGLSGGRVITLFLRSGGFEYATYTENLSESRERTQEASLLIKRALSEPQPFGWEGRQFSYRTVSIWPQMVQEAPPFYYSGNSVESAEFAAKNKFGLACSFFPPEFLGQIVSHYKAEADRAGWKPTRDQLVYRGLCVLGDTDKEAQEMAKAFTNRNNDDDETPVGQAFGNLQFVGSPSTVVEQLREIHEAGFGVADVLLVGKMREHQSVLRAIDLFAAEVLPEIRKFDEPAKKLLEV
ncbi:LLM class flavin-dependent oxidoreductase [Subtercola sp. YIM 133946]|uniref:LLM class flavin-dependent oxidoreductase n=1 Tax=Subtercola sp. YIM 133946 TaxID=3118909 RepID=UPI002F94EEC2